MNKLLYLAILGGLGAMLGWGINDFLMKKIIYKIKYISALFWMQCLGAIVLLLFFPFKFDISDLTFSNILIIAFWALIDGLGYFFLFRAFKKGKISIISPLVASYGAFSVIVSRIAFHEVITPLILFFLILIFLGIILTSTDFRKFKKHIPKHSSFLKGVPEAIIAVIFFSFWFPFWDNFVSTKNSWFTLLIVLRIFMALLFFLFAKYKSITLKIKNFRILSELIYIALLDLGAYLILTWAYSNSNYSSITSILSATFSVPTLILARIFLKEKLKNTQWIGIIMIISGLILISGLSGKL